MYLIFDTETTGLMHGKKVTPKNLQHLPHVIQLAYMLIDDDFNEVETFCELIKPDGWQVPTSKFWIDNGYSTEQNKKLGVPMKKVLPQFCDALNRSHTIVGHNLQFDNKMISVEMLRHNILPAKKAENKVCTMMQTIKFCKLPKPNGNGYKFAKLVELHKKLFGSGFENAHDALEDVRATARCFVELKKRNVL
jgi:DNA polymerase III epsilon subunit-like protein